MTCRNVTVSCILTAPRDEQGQGSFVFYAKSGSVRPHANVRGRTSTVEGRRTSHNLLRANERTACSSIAMAVLTAKNLLTRKQIKDLRSFS